jgi:ParB-like chromosome segregation protein Spo0J
MGDNGYALDMLSPVRHVATEMDWAAPAALSIEEMAANYRHPNPGDLARVRQHEGCANDDAAVVWLIRHAVEAISYRGKTDQSKPQLDQMDGRYWLVMPFDELRYEGKKIERARDDHARLGDPFNPMSGVFAENIRRGKQQPSKQADEELRESMRAGWLPGHPAIVDERGVVIVGHRRLAIAEELGIEKKTERITFGDGDAGDIERLRLALQSNLGAKPFSPSDRAEIAKYLTERGWTQASIGEALHVARTTITSDLKGFVSADKPPRPKGGRPRKLTTEQEQQVAERHFEQGEPRAQIAADLGVGDHVVQNAIERERGRREGAPAISAPAVAEHACPDCGAMHPVTGS